jgi:hypothetical protein
MLITPLFIRSFFLLKIIVLSINVDYPIVCPFVFFTYGYCVVHQGRTDNNGVINIGGQHNNLK